MAFTGICTSRIAGFKIADEDIDAQANINPNKLGLRQKYVSFNPAEVYTNGTVIQDGPFPAIEFDNTNVRYLQLGFALPGDYASDTEAALDIFWKSISTSGNVRFAVELASVGEGSPSTSPELIDAIVDAAAPVSNQINKATLNLAAGLFAANDIVGIKITRDPANSLDTLENAIQILVVRFVYYARG